jgi:hypothetical protein
MDLNDFIFRDDTAETLGAPVDETCEAPEESEELAAPAKAGLAAVGSVALGLSGFLGHIAKGL